MKKLKYTVILILIISISGINVLKAQGKYLDKSGKIEFEASETLFEPVKATNESVTVILNTETNEIAALALMKSFRFKNSLMEEHFNENYIESEIYPKAIFKGKLLDFDYVNLTESETEVVVEGTLEIHGKIKEIITTLKISKSNGFISVIGLFTVTPSDFDIEIPKVVENKIAKQIVVSLNFNLTKK